ncbi:MAG: NADPH-dependent 7-cyano-7-deazaguanine reductase QueF [Gammaproteobacteria bacterium]|nr:NADPH-dependent 7-cyano-7-deazaguanine reductase QueF [Gammaproteobacteria bacterium]MDH4253462.1 NADPH-dependent 7-cyano-7-deazaguanine reductase QueF [Gammaproteobacteria bacterium]MDH5308517.1 NADPH-dependent 7-cyano-7-deazaguanine reductase QueF [Gammaproteobacteria bacterium]
MGRSGKESGVPLGRELPFPREYAPDVLFAVSRSETRRDLAIPSPLPFRGIDIWNAWELTWLDRDGRPRVATAEIRVPADSESIVESKSLKLYLNSFAYSRYRDRTELAAMIRRDLSATVGSEVAVTLAGPEAAGSTRIAVLPGDCIDAEPGNFRYSPVDASRLRSSGTGIVDEALYSHLLRSNCPVTNQPDMGSVLIRYRGRPIDRGGLLEYIVSYRDHNAFHEACVEQMFMDIRARCGTESLSVYARYTRRGGIDINPFRSDCESSVEDLRLWRQ